MKEFMHTVMGDISTAKFLGILFVAYLTAFTLLMFGTTKRDINSPRSPFHFSWSYLWCDQNKRIVGTILLILLSVRFSQKWIPEKYEEFAGAFIGLISDSLSKLVISFREKVTNQVQNRIDKI